MDEARLTRRNRTLREFASALAALAMAWFGGGALAAPASIAPGLHERTVIHEGMTRKYLLQVPRSYAPSRATLLLLALHGGGGDMHVQADDQRYGLISASEQHGFIAVFPNGVSPLRSGKLATWNAGHCCARARDQDVDDVGFIREVITDVQRQLSIEPRRIFAIGMSNGGMLAYRLACEMADVLNAVASVTGTDNTRHCTPVRPIPVLHIHARNDDHVLFEGGARAGLGSRRSAQVTDFTSVPVTIERWVAHNACTPTPTRVLDVPGAYCERYTACQAGVEVQLCVTETGGHSWPGGHKTRASEPSSKALSANDVMWDFFMRQPLR